MALEKHVVVQTALALLDEVGSDGLTMRVLAKALDVQAPTLYWHFPSKQALFDQMADAIIASVPGEVDACADPDALLSSLAVALRRALLSRRDGARVYAGTYVLGANVLAVAELALAALLRKGLDKKHATDAMFNLVYYVLGFVIEEQGFRQRWRGGDGESTAREQFGDALDHRHPALRRCAAEIIDTDFDRRFSGGLAAFIGVLDEQSAVDNHKQAD